MILKLIAPAAAVLDRIFGKSEHAAVGFWTTPTELAEIGISISRSLREDGLLCKKTAERMLTPVLENVGLCVFRDGNALAGHNGWNKGFLTVWAFSLTEDLCVAAMINRSTNSTFKRLSKIGGTLIRHAREQQCDQSR